MTFFFAEAISTSFPVASILVAAFGGIVVFLGLWMERGNEATWFKSVSYRRRQESKAHFGWWVLMIGIVIEIVDAGWTAKEIWEMKIIAEKHAPLNQPASDFSARMIVKLRGRPSSVEGD